MEKQNDTEKTAITSNGMLPEVKPCWINVEERLPDTYCSVLVYDPNNPFNSSMDVARFDAYQKCFFFSGGDTIHPSHWQPLPEKPLNKV